jgi:hypothetical protein
MNGKHKLPLALAAAAVLALTCGLGIWVVGGGPNPAPVQQQQWVETEDCDAEDWANYEAECYRASPKAKTTPRKTAAPKAPTARRSR